MPNFITVLDKDLDKTFWVAVQWGETIEQVRSNFQYTSGTNMDLPKTGQEELEDVRDITDKRNNSVSSSTIIKLHPDTVNLIKLAANKLSIKKVNSLTAKLNK